MQLLYSHWDVLYIGKVVEHTALLLLQTIHGVTVMWKLEDRMRGQGREDKGWKRQKGKESVGDSLLEAS